MEEVLEITRDSLGGPSAIPSAPVVAPALGADVFDVEYDDRPGWDDDGEGEEQEFDCKEGSLYVDALDGERWRACGQPTRSRVLCSASLLSRPQSVI